MLTPLKNQKLIKKGYSLKMRTFKLPKRLIMELREILAYIHKQAKKWLTRRLKKEAKIRGLKTINTA